MECLVLLLSNKTFLLCLTFMILRRRSLDFFVIYHSRLSPLKDVYSLYVLISSQAFCTLISKTHEEANDVFKSLNPW